MEFLGAAAVSDGHTGSSNPMLELYRSGDPYLNFGKIIGQIAPDATRETPGVKEIRERLKVLCLGTQYGMQTATLATRLGVSDIEAHEMLLHHRGLFSQYWHWSEDWLQHALDSGTMKTVFGWQCATGIAEFNERSIRNWPVQSTCADLFRLAYVWGTRHGLTLIAPVHDAVLLEAPEDQIEADVALMREIMRRASRVILNPTAGGTIELRTDAKIVRYPDRCTDSRGTEMWETVLKFWPSGGSGWRNTVKRRLQDEAGSRTRPGRVGRRDRGRLPARGPRHQGRRTAQARTPACRFSLGLPGRRLPIDRGPGRAGRGHLHLPPHVRLPHPDSGATHRRARGAGHRSAAEK
jgi:DNA polymerase family A